MLYEPTNTPAVARTSNLNEELGQVMLLVQHFYELHLIHELYPPSPAHSSCSKYTFVSNVDKK